MSNSIIDENLNKELEFDEEFFEETKSISIPLSANGWVTKYSDDAPEVITDFGLGNWMTKESVISVYFYTSKPGQIDVWLRCKVPSGKSRLQLSIEEHALKVDVKGDQYDVVRVGKFAIQNSGYVKLDMKGVNKTGDFYADVSHLVIASHLVDSQCISYIHEEPKADVYWSRRGPSVHLDYHLPVKEECQYYYNEVTVPQGFDPIGSYFMVIGFEFGYFGLQVNSETERRILFSVWSPHKTNNPKEVSEEDKVKLVSKSPDVIAQDFGGEGSGIQSILRYMWHSGITYKFLLNGKPDPHDSTQSIYTAWFAELNKDWKLVASLKRPKTNRHLLGFYSFVESFIPEYGYLCRKALFGNQSICDLSGNWHEVTRARLTGDSTAKNKVRLDFEGGVERNNQNHQLFYLQNCGFVDGKVALLSELKRTENKIKPKISLKKSSAFCKFL